MFSVILWVINKKSKFRKSGGARLNEIEREVWKCIKVWRHSTSLIVFPALSNNVAEEILPLIKMFKFNFLINIKIPPWPAVRPSSCSLGNFPVIPNARKIFETVNLTQPAASALPTNKRLAATSQGEIKKLANLILPRNELNRINFGYRGKFRDNRAAALSPGSPRLRENAESIRTITP